MVSPLPYEPNLYRPSRDRSRIIAELCYLAILLVVISTGHAAAQNPTADSSARGFGLTSLAPSSLISSGLGVDSSIPATMRPPSLLRPYFYYDYGHKFRLDRFGARLFAPVSLTGDDKIFFQGNMEYLNFSETVAGGRIDRVNLSAGGGYRKIFNDSFLLGANGFLDWTSAESHSTTSGGAGCELWYIISQDSMVDLSINYYSSQLGSIVGLATPTQGHGNCDFRARYSQSFMNQAFRVRLKAEAYRFECLCAPWYGWSIGADLTTRDRTFLFSVQTSEDGFHGSWVTVGAVVSIGLDINGVLEGASPIRRPLPIYSSPPDLETESVSEGVDRKGTQNQQTAASTVQAQMSSGSGCLPLGATCEVDADCCSDVCDGECYPK